MRWRCLSSEFQWSFRQNFSGSGGVNFDVRDEGRDESRFVERVNGARNCKNRLNDDSDLTGALSGLSAGCDGAGLSLRVVGSALAGLSAGCDGAARLGVPVKLLLSRRRLVIEEGRDARLGVPVNWLLPRSRYVIEEGRDARLGVPVKLLLYSPRVVIEEGRDARLGVPVNWLLVR